MAHFARLDKNNCVCEVVVVDNAKLLLDGEEVESKGIEFLNSLGMGENWIQTSYSGSFRRKFAGVGDFYDADRNIFIEPEYIQEAFDAPWMGLKSPSSPSIMVDAAPRSGNKWLLAILKTAFPQAFIRWGYLNQHNPETFIHAVNNFDLNIAIVRNPLDSVASSLNIFGFDSDAKIKNNISNTNLMLKSIRDNKNKLYIISFDKLTNQPDLILNEIAIRLKLEPKEVNYAALKETLNKDATNTFYSVPVQNQDVLSSMKEILSAPSYIEDMTELNNIYQEIFP